MATWESSTDEAVVVCGGGAAGMAAALAAARANADVWFIESSPNLGGTVAACLIHTLGGIYDSDGQLLNHGLSAELAHRLRAADPATAPRRIGGVTVLGVRPELYQRVTQQWIEATPRIRVACATQVQEIERRQDRVVSVHAEGPQGRLSLRVRGLLDATGSAAMVRQIDPDLVQNDEAPAAGGWIFRIEGVAAQALAFPRRLGLLRAVHEAATSGRLPASCAQAWIDVGLEDGEVYVKLFVPLSGDWRERENLGEISGQAQQTQGAVFEFLRTLPDFTHAQLAGTGRLGIRDGGRIRGEYVLTAADVRQGRKFPDGCCRCSWPIEHWDSQKGLTLEYLQQDYQVPLRALKVAGLSNVWAAGKCLSADRWAQASARVVGSCWAMGEAVGRAAAGIT